MMRRSFSSYVIKPLALVTLSLALAACSHGPGTTGASVKEKLSTDSMKEVAAMTAKMRKKWGAENVLVVFDIDNTVLAMRQSLGSDQWFTWQDKMLGAGKGNGLVAKDFGQLLTIQYQLFHMSSMTSPEMETPALVAKMQTEGHPVIALTSRGYKSVKPTLRELKSNGFEFAKTSLQAGVDGVWSPYDPGTVTQLGFSESEKKPLRLDKKPRDVTYQDGVFLTAGQHKGVMLRILLHKSGYQPKAIVFIDDHEKHSVNMHAAYVNKPVDVVTYRYGREDLNVQRFKAGPEKEAARIQWQELQATCKKKSSSHLKSLIRAIFAKSEVDGEDLKVCQG